MADLRNAPIVPVTFGPVTVQWEHLFAPDEKRVVNGKNVGDDRYNLTVLFGEEAAQPALKAAAQAVQHATSNADAIKAAVFERIKPVDDDELKKLGFAFRMKTYSRDPVPVVDKRGGRAIEPPAAKLAAKTYPQFGLGVKQGAQAHLAVAFRVYENSEGAARASAFLNAVLVDTAAEPVKLPGGRPDPNKLFGHLIEGAASVPGAEHFAGLMDGENEKPAANADPLAGLGIKL